MTRPIAIRPAGEMTRELRAFITGGLVGAYQYSLPELIKRFVRKNRAAVATGTLGVLLLTAFGAWSFINITEQRNKALEEEAKAKHAALIAEAARKQAEARLDESILESAREAVNRDPTRAIALLKMLGEPIDGAATVAADAVERGVAERVLMGHDDHLEALAFSPDSKLVATAGLDKSIRVWPLNGGEPKVLTGHGDRGRRVGIHARWQADQRQL